MAVLKRSFGESLLAGMKANLIGGPMLILVELIASVVIARLLGAQLLAELIVIRALAQLTVALADLGITTSVSKLVPDMLVTHSRYHALRLVTQLTWLRLTLIPFLIGGMYFVGHTDWLEFDDGSLAPIIAVVAALMAGFSIINGTKRYVLLSALQVRDVTIVNIMGAIFGPIMNVVAAFIWGTPLAVAISIILNECIIAWMLFYWLNLAITIDEHPSTTPLEIGALWLRYRTYILMNYAKFVFNKAVIRIPFIVLLLGVWGASAPEVANAAIALSLVFRLWEIVNLPLSQMRAPILSWLHANQDKNRMLKLEHISCALITISSGMLAVGAYAFGYWMLLLLYGQEFESAAKAVGPCAVIALIGTMFSLGNNTLQQTEHYRIQVAAMGVAILLLIISAVAIFLLHLSENLVLFGILLLLTTRLVFWIVTDIAADRLLFNLSSTAVKLRGVFALLTATYVIYALGADAIKQALVTSAIGLVVFLLVFRSLGGVGKKPREILGKLLPEKYRWWVVLL